MEPHKFFTRRTIGFSILLVIGGLVISFYALNNYIYKEKQGNAVVTPIMIQGENKYEALSFIWSYEKDKTLNPDGQPQNNIFLEVKYANGVEEKKLIDTTPGSCNDLPDKEADSVPDSTNIQCYYAGLGYRFKITKKENLYLVQRKTFEEALPDYDHPKYKYEVVSEFPLYK